MEAILGSVLGIIFAGIITALVKTGVDSMITVDAIEDEEENARQRAGTYHAQIQLLRKGMIYGSGYYCSYGFRDSCFCTTYCSIIPRGDRRRDTILGRGLICGLHYS